MLLPHAPVPRISSLSIQAIDDSLLHNTFLCCTRVIPHVLDKLKTDLFVTITLSTILQISGTMMNTITLTLCQQTLETGDPEPA